MAFFFMSAQIDADQHAHVHADLRLSGRLFKFYWHSWNGGDHGKYINDKLTDLSL